MNTESVFDYPETNIELDKLFELFIYKTGEYPAGRDKEIEMQFLNVIYEALRIINRYEHLISKYIAPTSEEVVEKIKVEINIMIKKKYDTIYVDCPLDVIKELTNTNLSKN